MAALAGLGFHGDHLGVEIAVVNGLVGAPEAFDGIGILVLPGEPEMPGVVFAEYAHQGPLLVGILEAVQEHGVLDHVVAEPRTGAMLGQQIGRVGHGFHAAAGNQDIGSAGGQGLVAEDGGLHSRTAHLVDSGRLHRLWQAGGERGLAGGSLAEPGGQHATHIDAIDGIAARSGAFHGGLDRGGPQVGGLHGGE